MASTRIDESTEAAYLSTLGALLSVTTHVILTWSPARGRFIGIATHS